MTMIELRTKSPLLNDLAHGKITLPPWKPREVADRLLAVLKVHPKGGVLVVVTEVPENPLHTVVDAAVDQMLQTLIVGASAMKSVPCDQAITDALRERAGDDFAKIWLDYVEDLGL